MRQSAVVLAAWLVIGCEDKRASAPKETASLTATTAVMRAKSEAATVQIVSEPETDKEPPRFDPANAKRTLRWIVTLADQARQPAVNRAKAAEQLKALQATLSDCLKQTVKWKVPLEAVGADGMLSFSPFRTTAFADRSEKHPEMTLRIRPWNSLRVDSLFACPAHPWVAGLRPGEDSVLVEGLVTGITTRDNYDWYVSLTEVQFAPASDAATSPRPETPTPENFDLADADKAFAWLRQQCFVALDPFGTPSDRERRQRELTSQFRSLAGTRVRWSWPTVAPNDFTLSVQDFIFTDFPHQTFVGTGLLLKQPKLSTKPGQLLPVSRTEYAKGLSGSPGNKMINPEVTKKIREAKKSTVSGKVAKVTTGSFKDLLPRNLEIAVWLDEVTIEP